MTVVYHETAEAARAYAAASTRLPSGWEEVVAVAIFRPIEGSFDLCRFPRGGLLAVTAEQAARLSTWPPSTVSVVPLSEFGRVRLHFGTGSNGEPAVVGYHLTAT